MIAYRIADQTSTSVVEGKGGPLYIGEVRDCEPVFEDHTNT